MSTASGNVGLIGIDVGTYGSKGVLVRPDGTVAHEVACSHDMATPHPGWAEQDADAIWWKDVCRLSRELSEAAGRERLAIGGAAVSAIGPTCLPVDADGRPLRPAILYGIDTRASREIAELDRELGAERILEVSGSPLTSQAVGPKIRWLQRHEPEVWARTAKVLTAHSYLAHRLTGRFVVDAYSAAAQTPLFDLRAGRWSEELVAPICPIGMLPEVVRSGQLVGEVGAAAAEETGLPAGTPIAAGTIDAAAEALAAGVSAPGDMMVMYGTTTFFIEVTGEPVVSPKLWGGVWLDGRRAVLTGGMSTTGAITEWMRRELTDLGDEAGFQALFDEADASAPGAHGVLVLPYFSGERTPINAPEARGVIAGLSLATRRGDLVRAVLEAIAFGVRHHLEAMEEAGATPQRLVAIGGGVRSRTLLQTVSDVTGLPQDVPGVRVGAAYGDALLAGVATGTIADLEAAARLVTVTERVEPDPATRDRHGRRYRAYRRLFDATRDVMEELAAAAEADE